MAGMRGEGAARAKPVSPLIRVEGAAKSFGTGAQEVQALADIDLEVFAGELFAVVGPSGCGKSSLLDLIAGFARPDRGRVLVHGEEVGAPDPRRLLVFQEYGLFPWRTARRNVELGLEIQGVSRRDRRTRAERLLERVGLSGFEDHRPGELSGGMRQRVNIARALAVDPEVLLLDEPFGAVDAFTRLRLQDDLLSLQRDGGKTVIMVTHDIEEAVYLGDRVGVMTERPGRLSTIVDIDTPEPRDRGSPDFLRLRERIMEEFRLLPERRPPEYSI